MIKKQDSPKLQHFSTSIVERFDCEIHRILQLLQSERITFQRANEMLHSGKEDLQVIYYHVQCQIAAAQTAIINLRKNGRFTGKQIEDESILSLASRRAVISMRTAIRDYQSGELTKRQLRRARRLMMDCVNQDVASLGQEVQDVVRKLKVEPKKEVDQDWRVQAKEMAVKKG